MDAKQARFAVSIAGTDVTSRIGSDVMSIKIRRASGATADTAEIVLDDRDGHIVMPKPGAEVAISLGWRGGAFAVVFEGSIDDSPRSEGARGQGRVLIVTAKSADVRTAIKQPEEKHEDDASLDDVMGRWAKEAGLAGVRISADLGKIQRPYWSMNRESFIAFGQRIAREVGGTFKIMGDQAVMVPRSGGVSASGRALSGIRAAWGENLISWKLTPFRARPPFQSYDVHWYDRKQAKHQRQTVQAKLKDLKAGALDRFSSADEGAANSRAKSTEAEGERESGGGTVMIDGDPAAEPEAPCTVAGVRPGINGTYRIDSVEDSYDRSGGYVTTLELKQPGGTAGADER